MFFEISLPRMKVPSISTRPTLPSVDMLIGGRTPPPVTRAFLADAALEAALVERRTFTLAITSKADGAVIGSVAVWEVSAAHRRAELGFVLNPKFQGRGYASEAGRAVLEFAFARFGAQRVQATCRPENSASASVLTKIGMEEEGRMRHTW